MKSSLGDIVERSPTHTPKPLQFASAGFPLPTNRKVLGKSTTSPPASKYSDEISQQVSETLPGHVAGEVENNWSKNVLGMSQEDAKNALRDISSILSPDSVQFLTRRAQSNVTSTTLPPTMPKSYESNDCLNPKVISVAKQSHGPLQKIKRVDFFSANKGATNFAVMNSEREEVEIHGRLHESHSHPRPSIDNASNISLNDAQKICSHDMTPWMNLERFDLYGRRVFVKRSSLLSFLVDSMDHTSIFFDLSKEFSLEVLTLCAEMMLELNFVVEINTIEKNLEPQHELLSHERGVHLPGYNFEDISKMFRSEVPAQRSIALKILTGILRNKDYITSCECLGYTHCCTSYSVASHREKNILNDLHSRFSRIYSTVRQRMRELGHRASNEVDKKLRRSLTRSLLSLCCSDLPSELSVMLLWGIKTRSFASHTTKLATLQCLKLFLCSEVEEHVAESLWSGRIIRTPVLQSPHSRNDEGTYEDIETTRLKLQEKSGNLANDASASFMEQFPQLCKVGSIDAFVKDIGFLDKLIQCVIDALPFVPPTSRDTTISTNSVSSEIILALEISLSALDLLCVISRAGNNATINEMKKCLQKVWRGLSSLSAIRFESYIEFCTDHHILKKAIVCNWWRLLAEVFRRDDSSFVAWVWTAGDPRVVDNFFSDSLLGHIVSDRSPILTSATSLASPDSPSTRHTKYDVTDFDVIPWALRVLRLSINHGYGLKCLTEIFIAFQISQSAEQNVSIFKSIFPYGFQESAHDDVRSAEFLRILEVSAYRVADVFSAVARVSPDFDSQNINLLGGFNLESALEVSRLLITFGTHTLRSLHEERNSRIASFPLSMSAAYYFLLALVFVKTDNVPQVQHSSSSFHHEGLFISIRSLAHRLWNNRSEIFNRIASSSVLQLEDKLTHFSNDDNWSKIDLNEEYQRSSYVTLNGYIHVKRDEETIDEYDFFDSCGFVSKRTREELAIAKLRLIHSLITHHTLCLQTRQNAPVDEGTGISCSNAILSCHFASFSLKPVLCRVVNDFLESNETLVAFSPSIANGLVAWEWSKLYELRLISLLRLLLLYRRLGLVVSDTHLFSTLTRVIWCLGKHHIGMIKNFLAYFIITFFPDHNVDVLKGFLKAILGNEGSDIDFHLVDLNSDLNALCFSIDSLLPSPTQCHNSEIMLRLDPFWHLDCLCNLKSRRFSSWLKCLALYKAKSLDWLSIQNSPPPSAATFVYKLLRLTKQTFAHVWLNIDIEEVLEANEEKDIDISDSEPIAEALDAFRTLVLSYLNECCEANSFEVAKVAQDEMLKACRDPDQSSTFKRFDRKAATLSSMINFGDDLIESALGECISANIHGFVLSVLQTPLFIPQVREKVWQTLGSLRLIHLMNNGLDQKTLPLFTLKDSQTTVHQKLHIMKAILYALTNLRAQEDRRLLICRAGILQISNFIFQDEGLTHEISGPRSRLLMEIISDSHSYPDWLIQNILAYGACFDSCHGDFCNQLFHFLESPIIVSDATLQKRIVPEDKKILDLLILYKRPFVSL